MAGLDIDRLRSDTPGVAHRIHLNNAGSALMARPVKAAVTDFLELESTIGGYEAAEQEAERLRGVYGSVGRLIEARPDEIALMENATVAWDMAFYSLAASGRFGPGDRILTVQADYGANYVACLQVAKRTGATIEVIPNDGDGATDPAAVEAMIDRRVKLISMTWIPTNGGLVNPAAQIGRIARQHGVLYLLDACQAAGQLPIDVGALCCDMLTATGRKFLRGPRGTGFLYIRKDLADRLDPIMVDHTGARWVAADRYEPLPGARRFETFEHSHALRLGLGQAVDYALEVGIEAIRDRCFALGRRLRAGLRTVPGVAVHDLGQEPCAIVTFSIAGRDSRSEVKPALAARGINVSASGPNSTLIDSQARNLPELVRASPHYYNTEDEIDALIDAVREIAR